jgi:hypothetical protein
MTGVRPLPQFNLRWLLFSGVLLVTLWAGLDPRDYRLRNEVDWIPGQPGLRFGRYGRAETRPFLTAEKVAQLNHDGFTLELAFRSSGLSRGDFRILASVHAGDDPSQLIIGQWRDYLIVMTGDDYDHRRKLPRVTADLSGFGPGPLLVTLTSGQRGTILFVNGERAESNARLHLQFPSSPGPARLVIGCSVHASQCWSGDFLGLTVIPRMLSSKEVAAQFAAWNQSRRFAPGEPNEADLLYLFDDGSGNTVRDHGVWSAPLEIPRRLQALGRRVLAPIFIPGETRRLIVQDSVLNLFGFMPFGFSAALLLRPGIRSKLTLFLITTLAGFLLSLFIEVVQAWIPSRDSSLRDLLLNTVGTPLGVLVALLPGRRWHRSPGEPG